MKVIYYTVHIPNSVMVGAYLTDCPYGKKGLYTTVKVGSPPCYHCSYCRNLDRAKQEVACDYDEKTGVGSLAESIINKKGEK